MSNDRTSLFSNNPAAIPRSQAVGGCAPGPVASAELTGLTAVFAAAADPIAIFRLPADGPAELIYHNAACAELCGRGAGGAGLVQRHDALSTLFSQASSLDAWLRSPCGGARLLELSAEGRKRQALRFVSYGRLERDGGEPLGIVRIEPVARVPAAVQERDRSYRELAEAVADGTWETDSRLRLTRLSRDARRLLGIDPEDWAGCALRSLAGTDVQAGEWQAVEDAMLAHRPFSNITVQASGARGLQWLSLSGVPLHDEDGGLLGYCGALLDVTPRIEAERRAGHAAPARGAARRAALHAPFEINPGPALVRAAPADVRAGLDAH